MNKHISYLTNIAVWAAAAGLLAFILSIFTGFSSPIIVGMSIAVTYLIEKLYSKNFVLRKMTFVEILTALLAGLAAGIVLYYY